jgi:mRNA-degrading endonuclease RelE of RelBE toxin-antitoxin system
MMGEVLAIDLTRRSEEGGDDEAQRASHATVCFRQEGNLMPWELQVSKKARRELAALEPADRAAIIAAIRQLANDPSRGDFKKLQGGRGWRLRVGHWRVRLELDSRSGVMRVLHVLNRRDAYRD